MFGVMLYFYAHNWMGGGDVKILTVGFLWVGFACALPFAVLLAVFALVLWFYRAGHAALPQLDGRVRVSGVTAPVTVTRDSHGVPTIDAINVEDLFFAQGYVTAQDRLWQMDMTRRFAGGEMAEILGSDWIRHDRAQRILGLRARAQSGVGELSAREGQHRARCVRQQERDEYGCLDLVLVASDPRAASHGCHRTTAWAPWPRDVDHGGGAGSVRGCSGSGLASG